jgi:hypothetical protein
MENYQYEVGDTVIVSSKNTYGLIIHLRVTNGNVMYLVEYQDMSREWFTGDELSRLTSINGREEMRAFVEHHLGLNVASIGRILKCDVATENSLELSYNKEKKSYVVCHTLVFPNIK